MMYALNLDSNRRILSVTYAQYAAQGQPLVEELPPGDVTDYIYQGDGIYIYDPVPQPTPKLTAPTKLMPGEYFSIDNTIYKATTTIPCGDVVIPGTNCTIVNMADELNKQ